MSKLDLNISQVENGYIVVKGARVLGAMGTTYVAETSTALVNLVSKLAGEVEKEEEGPSNG